jgi:hypothetical protein
MGNERNSAPRMSATHHVRPPVEGRDRRYLVDQPRLACAPHIQVGGKRRMPARPPRKRFGREEPAASQL